MGLINTEDQKATFLRVIQKVWQSFLNETCPASLRTQWQGVQVTFVDTPGGGAFAQITIAQAKKKCLQVRLPWPVEGAFVRRSRRHGGIIRLVPRLVLEPHPDDLRQFSPAFDPLDLAYYHVVTWPWRLGQVFDRWLRRPVRHLAVDGKLSSSPEVWQRFLDRRAFPTTNRSKLLIPEIGFGHLFGWCSLLDETNPLARLTQIYTVFRSRIIDWGRPTADHPEGEACWKRLRAVSPLPEVRDIHPSYRGRLCPIESPESSLVGLTLQKAVGATIEPDTGRLSPADDPRPETVCSIGTLQVPFLSHNHSPRLMMGAKNLKQALPPVQAETPDIATGWEREVACLLTRETGAEPIIRAPHAGRIEIDAASSLLRIVGTGNGITTTIPLWEEPGTPKPVAAFGHLLVASGQDVAEGDPLLMKAGFRPAPAGGASSPEPMLALGRHLTVLYLPWFGWNFEDAIVAHERVREALACRLAVPLTWECPAHAAAGYDARQLLGREFRAGQPLVPNIKASQMPFWVTTARVIKVYTPVRGPVRLEKIRQPDGSLATRQVPTLRFRVLLETVQPLGVGDKLMGRYGNKGVVSRFLPEDQLPSLKVKDKDLGKPDLILNPMGVLSRKNPGQILETQAGLVKLLDERRFTELAHLGRPFACLEKGKGNADLALQILRTLEELGAERGEVEVIFPKNGHAVRAVAGRQYIVRLDHLPQAKLAIRGRPPAPALDEGLTGGRSPQTGQPLPGIRSHGVKDGRDGGQRLGEMEIWALLAHGLTENLAEILEKRSQPPSPPSHEAARPSAQTPVPTGRDRSWRTFQALLRALDLGIDDDGQRLFRLAEPTAGAATDEEGWQLIWVNVGPLAGRVRHPLDGKPLAVVRRLPDEFLPRSPRREKPWLACQYDEVAQSVQALSAPDRPGRNQADDPARTEAAIAAVQGLIDRLFGCTRGNDRPVALARRAPRRHPDSAERPGLPDRLKALTLLGMLDRKAGFLRRYLIGRRVDLSGRAVIVPDPRLRPDQVTLPGLARRPLERAVKRARAGQPPGWALLNRNPTLHRYNLLACQVKQWRPDAVIGLPPLLCGMFGADFDGDTMAFHIPFSREAEVEAAGQASFGAHAFSVATGKPLAHFVQDVKLGWWVLTKSSIPAGCEAARAGLIKALQAFPEVRRFDPETDLASLKNLEEAITDLTRRLPREKRARFLWKVSRRAFEAATLAGVSVGVADLLGLQPSEEEIGRLHLDWRHDADGACRLLEKFLQERAKSWREARGRPGFWDIPLSGARDGKFSDTRQLVAAGGAVPCLFDALEREMRRRRFSALPGGSGRFQAMFDALAEPPPVLGRFLAGLGPHEFWQATRDGRRGMAEKKLGTPPAGYFTRLLAEAAFPWRVSRCEDCGSTEGLRLSAESIRVDGGLTPELSRLVDQLAIGRPMLPQGDGWRSPLYCALPEQGHPFEICRTCLGDDPSTRSPFRPGEWIGLIAAESVGERGTQEAMKQFHKGAGGKGQAAGWPPPGLPAGLAAWGEPGARVITLFRRAYKLSDFPVLLALLYHPDGPFQEVYKDVRPVHFEILARTRRVGKKIRGLIKAGQATGLAGGALSALGFVRLAETLAGLLASPPAGTVFHPKTWVMRGRRPEVLVGDES